MKTLPATTDVVIVGAGPTGLSLACVLAAEGVSFVLVDQLAEGANTSRAAVVHARTLEVLEELKVTDRLRAEGHVVPRFTLRVRDRYLVGADGMHSAVRERAAIGFTGERYEQSFMLADVQMSWPLRADEVMMFLSPDGLAVVAPLPGGRHRIVATLDDAPERPSMADVQCLLDTRGPVTKPARVQEIVWSTRFLVHHRLADRYRAGRILLAGDAAHVHSSAGGQGMNTGIQDAVALGRGLAAVLGGRAEETRLDEYERTRRPVAERGVGFTDRATRMATLRTAGSRAMRNATISVIGRIPPVRRWLATELAGLHNRH